MTCAKMYVVIEWLGDKHVRGSCKYVHGPFQSEQSACKYIDDNTILHNSIEHLYHLKYTPPMFGGK